MEIRGGRGDFMALIKTNLNTNIAVFLHPDTNAAQLKGIIEKEHPSMCPDVGAIRVDAIKVKRRNIFFHLSELVPVESVFVGLAERNKCLYVDATVCSNQADKLKEQVADSLKVESHKDVQRKQSIGSSEKKEMCYRKEVIDESNHCAASRAEGDHQISTPKSEAAQKMCSMEKAASVDNKEVPLEISPPGPAASVTGLVTKYFPAEYDEVKSQHSPCESYGSCVGGSPLKLSRKIKARSSKSKVGKRVIEAGKCIEKSGSKKRSPAAALFQSKRHRQLAGNPKVIPFEISETDNV